MPAVLTVALLLGQALSDTTSEDVRLARIRKALERSPAIETSQGANRDRGPVFRVTVHGRRLDDSSPWANWTSVPPYIRPRYPVYHNEFLFQSTPPELRAQALYPVLFGVDVYPFLKAMVKGIQAEHHRREEERARRDVREALAEVLACRADPSRPGC